MSKTWNRWLIYGIGVLMLAVGITMNTKTGMGVSPIVSVAYSAARIFGWSLGSMTFAVYCLFVAGEFLLRGKHYRWKDLLQLPFSLVFGELLDLVDHLITYDSTHHSLAENLCFLVAAVVACGIGVVMTVNMQLVPNPGDGIVQALAERFGKEQGVMKNMFDTCCVALTVVLSLTLSGQVIGIGLGTIAAMVGVGRVISAVNHLTKENMCRAAGLM